MAKDDVKLPDGDLGREIRAKFDEGKDVSLPHLLSSTTSNLVNHVRVSPACCGSYLCHGRGTNLGVQDCELMQSPTS